jgi:hypothetical protein
MKVGIKWVDEYDDASFPIRTHIDGGSTCRVHTTLGGELLVLHTWLSDSSPNTRIWIFGSIQRTNVAASQDPWPRDNDGSKRI